MTEHHIYTLGPMSINACKQTLLYVNYEKSLLRFGLSLQNSEYFSRVFLALLVKPGNLAHKLCIPVKKRLFESFGREEDAIRELELEVTLKLMCN